MAGRRSGGDHGRLFSFGEAGGFPGDGIAPDFFSRVMVIPGLAILRLHGKNRSTIARKKSISVFAGKIFHHDHGRDQKMKNGDRF